MITSRKYYKKSELFPFLSLLISSWITDSLAFPGLQLSQSTQSISAVSDMDICQISQVLYTQIGKCNTMELDIFTFESVRGRMAAMYPISNIICATFADGQVFGVIVP